MNTLLVGDAANIAHIQAVLLAAAFACECKKAGPFLARLFIYGSGLISY
ncbi:hypothetical protein [Herminiimonas fonticola]|nr:hypothetical protein [Herminiimonas fonticola]